MRQTRSARVLLSRAADAVLDPILGGMRLQGVHFAEGGDPAGGGAGDPKPDPKKKDEPKKVELTEDELNQRIEAAKKEERDAAAETKKKEQEATAAEEAKKKGEWETLAKAAETKQKEAEAQVSDLKIDIAIRDALTDEKLRDYAGCAKYIKPQIDAALAGDQKKLDAAIKAAVDQYVKDNPRKPGGGPPPAPSRSGARGADVPPNPTKPTNGNRALAPASRF